MLKCKEAAELCSAEMERPLLLREQAALRTHLIMCTGCTNYRKQLKALRQVMQAYADGKAATADPKLTSPEPD
ncbi:MAG: zf-HC2 domain-containing protein [Burkholderiaceae bacterium]|nr:MAG: zf-HC2 domain-containing protein [Burkholderiaceae bacterium]TBR76935.1 MAG: zf-HC2 domain-containing protein [Burkholderiaceae bacterium]